MARSKFAILINSVVKLADFLIRRLSSIEILIGGVHDNLSEI